MKTVAQLLGYMKFLRPELDSQYLTPCPGCRVLIKVGELKEGLSLLRDGKKSHVIWHLRCEEPITREFVMEHGKYNGRA